MKKLKKILLINWLYFSKELIEVGDINFLTGKNGAGKSTTIKAILDLIRRDSGNIRVLGKDIRKKGKEIREDIGVVLDGASFHETLRAKEIGKFMGKIYQNWDEKYYQRLLKTFNVPGNKLIKNFSTGMKMKLETADLL